MESQCGFQPPARCLNHWWLPVSPATSGIRIPTLTSTIRLLCVRTGCAAPGYETAHAFDGKAQATPYQLEIQKWRQDEEKDIHDRWLSLVALAWLKEGKNNFGSDHHNEVVLPAHAAPPQAGYFELNKGV